MTQKQLPPHTLHRQERSLNRARRNYTMTKNDTLSSEDDDSRDGRKIVLDEGTRDMTRMKLSILVTKLKERCNAGESKLNSSHIRAV